MTAPEGDGGSDTFAPAALPPKTRKEFLLQAGLLNLGVLSAGAGLVVVAFTERVTGGVFLTVFGGLLLGLAYRRYTRESPSS